MIRDAVGLGSRLTKAVIARCEKNIGIVGGSRHHRAGCRRKIMTMFQSPNDARTDAPISDRILRAIVEQGFFGARGSLAYARAACAELIFARAFIAAQTARIAQLDSAAAIGIFASPA
jgi:hypothetical protein